MFWAFYNHMIRPNELPNSSDYHLFRDGVKPMWEVLIVENCGSSKRRNKIKELCSYPSFHGNLG